MTGLTGFGYTPDISPAMDSVTWTAMMRSLAQQYQLAVRTKGLPAKENMAPESFEWTQPSTTSTQRRSLSKFTKSLQTFVRQNKKQYSVPESSSFDPLPHTIWPLPPNTDTAQGTRPTFTAPLQGQIGRAYPFSFWPFSKTGAGKMAEQARLGQLDGTAGTTGRLASSATVSPTTTSIQFMNPQASDLILPPTEQMTVTAGMTTSAVKKGSMWQCCRRESDEENRSVRWRDSASPFGPKTAGMAALVRTAKGPEKPVKARRHRDAISKNAAETPSPRKALPSQWTRPPPVGTEDRHFQESVGANASTADPGQRREHGGPAAPNKDILVGRTYDAQDLRDGWPHEKSPPVFPFHKYSTTTQPLDWERQLADLPSHEPCPPAEDDGGHTEGNGKGKEKASKPVAMAPPTRRPPELQQNMADSVPTATNLFPSSKSQPAQPSAQSWSMTPDLPETWWLSSPSSLERELYATLHGSPHISSSSQPVTTTLVKRPPLPANEVTMPMRTTSINDTFLAGIDDCGIGDTDVHRGLGVAVAAACNEEVDAFIKAQTGVRLRRFLADLAALEALMDEQFADGVPPEEDAQRKAHGEARQQVPKQNADMGKGMEARRRSRMAKTH